MKINFEDFTKKTTDVLDSIGCVLERTVDETIKQFNKNKEKNIIKSKLIKKISNYHSGRDSYYIYTFFFKINNQIISVKVNETNFNYFLEGDILEVLETKFFNSENELKKMKYALNSDIDIVYKDFLFLVGNKSYENCYLNNTRINIESIYDSKINKSIYSIYKAESNSFLFEFCQDDLLNFNYQITNNIIKLTLKRNSILIV